MTWEGTKGFRPVIFVLCSPPPPINIDQSLRYDSGMYLATVGRLDSQASLLFTSNQTVNR